MLTLRSTIAIVVVCSRAEEARSIRSRTILLTPSETRSLCLSRNDVRLPFMASVLPTVFGKTTIGELPAACYLSANPAGRVKAFQLVGRFEFNFWDDESLRVATIDIELNGQPSMGHVVSHLLDVAPSGERPESLAAIDGDWNFRFQP
jgi:hypothetical protein